MKKKIKVLKVTERVTIAGPLATINTFLLFSLGLIVSTMFLPSVGFLAFVLFLLWQLLLVNIIIPRIEKVIKPKLTYNPETKKLKYFHHFLQFETFTNKSDITIYTYPKSKKCEIYYSYKQNQRAQRSALIQIDPEHFELMEQIKRDWNIVQVE